MSAKIQPKASKLPWIIVTLLIAAMIAAGGWVWYSSAAAAESPNAADSVDGDDSAENPKAAPRKPAIYFALEPSFVVNLIDNDAVRYLQTDVQLMTRDEATAKALELHAPAVRNRLLLLFGQHSASQLALRSAKERLQEKSRDEVRALLKSEGAPHQVDAVYFTSFVTQ